LAWRFTEKVKDGSVVVVAPPPLVDRIFQAFRYLSRMAVQVVMLKLISS